MNKLRVPNTIEDAITQAAAFLGVEKIADVIGKSTWLVRSWMDPDKGNAPSLAQSMMIDAAIVRNGEEPIILELYNNYIKDLQQKKTKEEDMEIIHHALQLSAMSGEISDKVMKATDENSHDGKEISFNEAVMIAQAINRTLKSLKKAEEAVLKKANIENNHI